MSRYRHPDAGDASDLLRLTWLMARGVLSAVVITLDVYCLLEVVRTLTS
jgi:hypothetical protein